MPLDSLGSTLIDFANIIDPFERIGIVPVPKAFVARYKKEYGDDWRMTHPYQFGRWQTTIYKPQRIDRSFGRALTLREFLANPTRNSAFATDRTSAPKKLVALALNVQRQVPDAVFSVDYFHDDPVLNVTIDGEKGCLGIWDDGEVTAIATKVS